MAGNGKGGHLTFQTGESELRNISLLADAMRQNIQQSSESLTRRMLEIQGIKDINMLAASRLTPQAVISQAVEKVIDITGAGGAAVFLVIREDEQNYVSCVYCVGEGVAHLTP